MFWLALPAAHDCSRPYAQTSRFELGEAMTRTIFSGAQLVVGIEPGFSNEKYIRTTLESKAKQVHILSNLADTLNVAGHAMEYLDKGFK